MVLDAADDPVLSGDSAKGNIVGFNRQSGHDLAAKSHAPAERVRPHEG